jgi:hypothetical protein
MLYAMLYIHMHNHVYCRYGAQLTSTLNGVILYLMGQNNLNPPKPQVIHVPGMQKKMSCYLQFQFRVILVCLKMRKPKMFAIWVCLKIGCP